MNDHPPRLKLLHAVASMSPLKLQQFRQLATEVLVRSLAVHLDGALKVRPDGTVLDGNHRVFVLMERGYAVDQLPRVSLPKQLYSDEGAE